MNYGMLPEQTVQENVRRVAREQIDRAVEEIGDASLDPHETVHQVRKRCKKVRGLLRLLRPALGDTYAVENAAFRDAARTLSWLRDSTSIIETFDKLLANLPAESDRHAFAGVREALIRRRDRIAAEHGELDRSLRTFTDEMQAARRRLPHWTLNREGFAAVKGGLRKTMRRARKAMHRARSDGTTADFHEWRKRVKYHWYHTRLLLAVDPSFMKPRCDALDVLSDLLGDDHDLAVLEATLAADPDEFDGRSTVSALSWNVDRRRRQLQSEAFRIGTPSFEKGRPSAVVKHLRRAWKRWSSAPEEQPA